MARTRVDQSLVVSLPTSKVTGTTTNDNAAAGYIGEYVSSAFSGSSFGSSTTRTDITSISLTAGDWDISYIAHASIATATGFTSWGMWITTTSGNNTTGLVTGDNGLNGLIPPTSTANTCASVASWRLSLSATTTVYAKITAVYSGGGPPTASGRISARRVR